MMQPYFQIPPRRYSAEWFSEHELQTLRTIHRAIPGYAPTPLVSLEALAASLGLSAVYIKDESKRFGLNAFKALGVSAALYHYLQSHPLPSLLVSATDGNHGRAVAWQARLLGIDCVIFMPKGSASARTQSIEGEGARVIVTDSGYDDAVRLADAYAKEHGGLLVQDTALPGDESRIPSDIVLGYASMALEALEQMEPQKPTHVFLQAGVGSMASGVAAALLHKLKGEPLTLILMEAAPLACIALSAREGSWQKTPDAYTLMAGLNCAEPNPATLPLLLDAFDAFFPLEDSYTLRGMRRLAHPLGQDPAIVSGESGAVGTGFLESLMTEPEWTAAKERLGLTNDSVVLLFSTEGDTDPLTYQRIIQGE